MSIRIYNFLTKQKEDFIPLKDKIINMYSCGVTVYDRSHIGHARSLYIFDVMRRYLKYRGFKINFVRNITDIDDKIINRAKELNKDWKEVVKENIEAYEKDLEILGIEKADKEPRATENVADMIKHIEGLINKGYAYESNGDVYFNVRKFKGYGKLSGQSIEKMLDSVRIEPDPNKKDPLDFALWKKSQEDERFWDSPWGNGRPGWHIECSCMSMKYAKTQTLDIHAGGRDLIFPHHENEIAQSEAFTDKPFAKYWVHHGLLTINGQKMSKSLGNFITIDQAVKKYSVDELKMFFLFSHYASPIDFSDDKMIEVHKALQKFDILFWKASEIISDKTIEKSKETNFVESYKKDFFDAMDDDFNTPKALASIFDLMSDTNKLIDQSKNDQKQLGIIYEAVNTIEELTKNIFGLFSKFEETELTKEEDGLLNERIKARKTKNFKRSDELRDVLKQKGIIVEDTKDGQTWRRA